MIKKLEKKLFSKKPGAKMTEKEKVEVRREEVLHRGRKFKYPLQFAKHKLVLTTIIISFAALVLLFAAGWWMLFKTQNTGDVMYRITRVLPVAVAKVDGEPVKYSDYLMFYRSSMKAVERQSGALGEGEDAENVRKEYKRAALYEAEELTFAYKIAKENGINVTNEEIEELFDEHRKVGGVERSEESFLKVVEDNFGLSKDEYKRMLRLMLYKKKVQEATDEKANELADKVEKMLKENGGDFHKVAEKYGKELKMEATGGLVDSKNIDGGRANVAMGLEKGKMSGKFSSNNGDGYYFVKLIDKNETKVNYESIFIPFTEFLSDFSEVENIEEYIKIEF